MACEEDPYLYVYENGYSSDDEDISDSLVNNIVEEAFRNEGGGNMNSKSRDDPCPSDSDFDSAPLEFRRYDSFECLPTIRITETNDDSVLDTGKIEMLSLNDSVDSAPRLAASDGFLPEKTVRFTQASCPSDIKKKYPSTPHKKSGDIGPSLSPMKTPLGNEIVADDATCGLTSLSFFPESPCNSTPHNPSPSTPVNGNPRAVDSEVMSFEEKLIKLNCILNDMNINISNVANEDKEKLPVEEMKEALSVLDDVSQKWESHKNNLEECLADSNRLQDDCMSMCQRLKEQNAFILKLKGERRALEEFLEEKEYEWYLVKKSLKADNTFLQSLVKEAKNSGDMDSLWKVLDSFLLVHFDREKAIALDAEKQNKINELRLVVCRQQLHLAEVEERNRELEWEITQQAGVAPLSPIDCNNNSCASVRDVLYCDHSWFSPHCSTNPQFASLQILNIGGPHPDLSCERLEPFNGVNMFSSKEDKSDLAQFDRDILEQLTNHGPGSNHFQLE